MRDYHKEFVYRKIKKPNKFLARIVFFIFGRISRKRNVEFVYDDDFNQIRDKQMILLCQHRSRTDFIYVYAGIRGRICTLCAATKTFSSPSSIPF